ncbi:MAG TPA: VWA domain-containing protein [Ignavibacteria bacterium]
MKKVFYCFFATVIILINVFNDVAFPQFNKLKFNYVFIIDISGSMDGKPQGSNNEKIFPKLKEVIKNFVNEIENANVFIYPFAYGIQRDQVRNFEIKSTNDRKKVNEYIDGLVANGSKTYIFESYNDASNDIKKYIESTLKSGEKQITLFYLYTDGKNEGGKGSMSDLISLQKSNFDKDGWIFYTTLGIEASKEDADLMNKNKENHIIYIPETRGEVSAIRLYHPVIPFLNFGNLKKSNQSSQTQLFTITGKAELPSNIKIKTELEFKNLHILGAGVKILPDEFSPTKEIKFNLQLVNIERIIDGIYEDTLKFIPSEEYLYIIPEQIPIRFTFTPDNVLSITPPFGENFPLTFGEVTPLNKSIQKSIKIDFNEQAKKSNTSLMLKFQGDQDNPSDLVLGRDILINDNTSNEVNINPNIKELLIKIIYSDSIKEGKYKGKILLEGSDLVFNSVSVLDSLKDNPQVKTIDVKFKINNPYPIWLKAGIISVAVALLFFLIWFRFLKRKLYPVFDGGYFDIEKLDNNKWTNVKQIYLSGNIRAFIGNNFNSKQGTIAKIFKGKILFDVLSDCQVQGVEIYFDYELNMQSVKLKTIFDDKIKISYQKFKDLDYPGDRLCDDDKIFINNNTKLTYFNTNSIRE